MQRQRRKDRADIPQGHEDPLSYAVTVRDRSVMEMVADAVRRRRVLLAYQPVMQALRPDRVAFYEALIRVQDETGRIIPARDFMARVEEMEIGRKLDCIALEKGLKALAEEPALRLSVNMSARSIGYETWMRTLRRGLQRDPTVAERLILEISESSAMTVPELVVSFMGRLSARGISFALDDFGAGQTSFRHLRDFSFDILKIDGQFIRGIHANPDNQVLTRALLAVAEQFDMFTVAEFVENAADAACLTEMGVDCLQGYYYAAPTVHPPWRTPEARQASA